MDWVARALLMTDVERSTLLWQEDAPAMASAIARHDEIAADIVASHDGRLIKARGEGDSTFSVFMSPVDAALASLAFQAAIRKEQWRLSRPIRVRAALTYGQIEDRAGDCYGPEVNRCARLRAAANPGQVLATRSIVASLEGKDRSVEVAALGKHRLKDLAESVEVFQLVPVGVIEEFEPIASLNAVAGFLPQFGSQILCRSSELDEIALLLQKQKLVTIVGPGGIGKSRLAAEAARRFTPWTPDGAHFVDLSNVMVGEHLPGVIATSLKLPAEASVSIETLTTELAKKEALLVLDGCEPHLNQLIPMLRRVLLSWENIKLLVTSRSTLKLTEEQVYRLPPLEVPESSADTEEIENSAAVRFFVSRATMARHDFAVTPKNARAIATICSQLDGIPAALEMAAVRVRSLTPEQIVTRLANRFRVLGQEGSTGTLKALFDWSWDSLSPEERRFAWCAAVFENSFDLEAAEAICEQFEANASRVEPGTGSDFAKATVDSWLAIDYIDSLVEKSLLLAEERDASMRYRLSSTFREYAREKWPDPAARQTLERVHAEHFLHMSRTSPKDSVKEDSKNFARAIEYFMAVPAPQDSAEMALFMTEHWQASGQYAEGCRTMKQCLAMCSRESYEGVQARLLNAIGMFEYYLGQFADARDYLTRAIDSSAKIGDAALRSKALNNLALLHLAERDTKGAISVLEEALPYDRAQNDDSQLSITLSNLGYLLAQSGDLPNAKQFLLEGLQVTGRSDNKRGAIPCLCNLSDLALEEKDLVLSEFYARRGMEYAEELSHKVGAACCLTNLGEVELRQGELDEAESTLRKALAQSIDMSASWMIGPILDLLGIVFWRKGNLELAKLALVHRQVASSLPSPPRFAVEANEIYALVEVQIGPEELARSRHRAELAGVSSLLEELPRASATLGSRQPQVRLS